MSTKTDALKQLREALANLYTSAADSIRIAEDAGLELTRLALDTPINTWRSILSEADKNNKIQSVLAVAIEEYPENAKLAQAYRAYLDTTNTVKKPKIQSEVQVRQPPLIDLDGYRSVLFQQYGLKLGKLS